jgi:hypothetical protein
MKGYPITDGELGQLFGIGALATVSFSIAAGLLGFAIDVTKDMAFSPDLPEAVITHWGAMKTLSLWACAALALVGAGFVLWGHSIIGRIKNQTEFPKD